MFRIIMKPIMIGISGRARSGKDTVGEYLRNNHGFVTYAFADPIKKAASEMFGIPLNYFYEDNLKETVIQDWGFSPRQIIQKLGTEAGREIFRDDIWIKRAEVEWDNFTFHNKKSIEKNMSYYNGMAFTDVRFENEASMIRNNGGIIMHIKKDNVAHVSHHKSEDGIEIKDGDVTINNNKTIKELYDNVYRVMSDIL